MMLTLKREKKLQLNSIFNCTFQENSESINMDSEFFDGMIKSR